MNILKNEIPTNIKPNTWVGVDTEFFGMNKKQLHRPSGTFACLTIALDHNTVLFIDKEELIAPALSSIDKCVWCIQKAMFDIVQLRRYATVKPRKRIWDTMLVERIMFGGYYNEFNLKALVRRWLQERVNKEARELFSLTDIETPYSSPVSEFAQKVNSVLEAPNHMTDEMINYACLDAVYCLRVAQEQRKAIDEKSFKVWTEIDRPAMWAFLDFQGFAINVEAWKTLALANEQRYKEIDAQLPINPRSPKQVLDYLKRHGFSTIKATGEKELQKAISKKPDTEAAKVAQLILESRLYQTRASRYGMAFVEDYLEQDNGIDVIVCEYDINKAETGRSASNSPNMQNIVARDTKEFRDCFVARPGNKLIIADYAAQEPRITAYLSGDECLLEWFATGKDPYIEIAKMMFKENITKSDPRRAKIKAVLLGLTYGMSKYGLARQENIPIDEAEELIENVLSILKGLSMYMYKQSQTKEKVSTINGRRIWLNPYDSQHERNALNGPVQGCLSFDQQVLTQEYGLSTIDSIQTREDIHIWDGQNFVKAQVMYSGKKEEIEIELYGGEKIRCSKDHKFLTYNSAGSIQWRTPLDFPKQVFIARSTSIPSWNNGLKFPEFQLKAHNAKVVTLNSIYTDDFLLGCFIGRLASDGNVTQDKQLSLHVAEHELPVREFLENFLSEVLDIHYGIHNVAERKNFALGYKKFNPVYRIDITSAYLAKQLYPSMNQIPYEVLGNSEMLRGYLCGFFDGDGTVNRDNIVIHIGNNGRKSLFIHDIQTCLNIFGIRSRIRYNKESIALSVMKQDCSRFCDLIGFINPVKQKKALQICPAKEATSNYIYGTSVRVKSVKYTGHTVNMYDVVNSETERFVVNGYISHNSAADMMKKSFACIHQGWLQKWGKFGAVAMIHDEAIFDVPEQYVDEIAKFVKVCLEDTATAMVDNKVLFVADVHTGDTWASK